MYVSPLRPLSFQLQACCPGVAWNRHESARCNGNEVD
jgi:hypothetical protein